MIGTKLYVILLGCFILMAFMNIMPEFKPFLTIMLLLTLMEFLFWGFDIKRKITWHRTCPECGTLWTNDLAGGISHSPKKNDDYKGDDK